MKKFLLSLALLVAMILPVSAKVLYTCQFGANFNQESISSYEKSWQVKVGDNTWTLANFNNNNNKWDYVKCGRKNNASVGTVTTDFAIPEAISSVVANLNTITAAKINAIKLETSAAADFATIETTVEIPADNFKTGNMTFTLPAPKGNLYYRITFDCASGSANGLVTLNTITYNDADETPVETEEVADIAAFIAKADKINPVIIKNAVEVIYQIGTNLFVKDNSGRILIYGKIDQTYQSGDSIPGGFQGVYGVYGGNPQITKAEGLKAAFGHKEVAPRVVTLAEITSDDVFDYVEINGVTFAAVNDRNITFKQGETEFAGYNQFNKDVTLPTEFEGKTYNIKAIIGSYNGSLQVQPVEIEETTSSTIDEIGADENAPVEYFNLQGIRVDNPEAGLYIRRQGSKVSKVVIR